MKPGQKVKIVKGPYKGMTGILKRRSDEHDQRTKELRAAWTVWIVDGELELVYENEVRQ